MEQKRIKTHYLKDYTPPDFLINTIHLHIDLHEDYTVVKSILDMKRNTAVNTPNAQLVLDGEELELNYVSIDGKRLSTTEFDVTSEHLRILQVPDQFLLETEVVIKPQLNTQLKGLFKSRGNFCTQCEPHGFRHITYYLDRPDVMARFITTITGDKDQYPILLANGNLIQSKELSGNRHWVHWEDPTVKPCYLFAMVAGDFDFLEDQFVTMSGRTVNLHMYLEKGFGDQGAYALEALKNAMRWDEQAFGREYDLDIYMIVAVSDFNMGAMENKGLNIFNTKYILAKPETATDIDYVKIAEVIGHEYFHNWSGNRVTCRDWFQITLKEGLTVLREQLFSHDMTHPALSRIDEVNYIRNRQFSEDSGPMAHPIRPSSYMEINNFYTSTVYQKGAEVIRMVRTLLGPAQFRKAMDLYFSRHDGQAVTVEDFIQAMADASGKDFTQFMRWYNQSGTPQLDVSGEFNAQDQTFTLTVKQSCPPTPGQSHKEPLHLPLALALFAPQNATPIHEQILEIKEETTTFTFTDIKDKPIPSLLRDFSAPVNLNYSYQLEELAYLLLNDTDLFSQWDAGQKLATSILLDLVARIKQQQHLELPVLMIETFDKLLTKSYQAEDFNTLARLVSLPAEQFIGQQMSLPIAVDEIHEAREFMKRELAMALEKHFFGHYTELAKKDGYQFDMAAMGKRSFKNLCLNYLVIRDQAFDSNNYPGLAYQQFKDSDNMTDAMGALVALNDSKGIERADALALFYQKWQNEPLVVNKWLLLQASSALPGTLTQVKELLNHPAFCITNPNNVYALILGFGQNTTHFHAADGSGYQFLVDQILVLNQRNPQVASRIIEPLTQWKKYDERRQQLMQTQLQRLATTPDLCKDVYEIVEKSLQREA